MQSETADSVVWSRFARARLSSQSQSGQEQEQNEEPDTTPAPIRAALSRIEFTHQRSPAPLHAAIHHLRTSINEKHKHKRVLVVVGRSKRLAVEDHYAELKELVEEERYREKEGRFGYEVLRKTIGDVGCAFVVGGASAGGVVVMQAANVAM